MLNSEIARKAHRMAKEIKNQYPEVNYRFQYGLCLSYLLNEKEEGKMTLEQIKAIAKENNLEANLWEKNGLKRIYLNRYTGSGYQKASGCLIIENDGTINIDKKGPYTSDAKAVWYAIPENAKLEVEA